MMDTTCLPMSIAIDDAAVIIATLSSRVALARAVGDEQRAAYYASVLDRFDEQVVSGIIEHATNNVTPIGR